MGGHWGTKLRDAACQDLHPFHADVSPFPFVYPAAQFHMAPSPSWVLGTRMWACPQRTAIPGSRSCSTAMARRCPVLPITKQLAKHKLINHLCLPVRSMIPEIFNLKIFPFRNPDAAISATLFFICFQVFFSISVLPGLHSICVWAFDALLFSDSFFNRGKGIYSLYFIASSYGEYYHFFTFWKSSDAGMS